MLLHIHWSPAISMLLSYNPKMPTSYMYTLRTIISSTFMPSDRQTPHPHRPYRHPMPLPWRLLIVLLNPLTPQSPSIRCKYSKKTESGAMLLLAVALLAPSPSPFFNRRPSHSLARPSTLESQLQIKSVNLTIPRRLYLNRPNLTVAQKSGKISIWLISRSK